MGMNGDLVSIVFSCLREYNAWCGRCALGGWGWGGGSQLALQNLYICVCVCVCMLGVCVCVSADRPDGWDGGMTAEIVRLYFGKRRHIRYAAIVLSMICV